LRPSWLADGRLLGNPSSAPEEDANYDTGIDLTEADFIADDLDTEQDSTGYSLFLFSFVLINQLYIFFAVLTRI